MAAVEVSGDRFEICPLFSLGFQSISAKRWHLVTIDAMGCQKKIAANVLHKSADYLLSVKDNQPKLVKAFEQAVLVSELVHLEGDAYVTDEEDRGRQETHYHIAKEFTKEY